MALPHLGHELTIGPCVTELLTNFIASGITTGLDTTICNGEVVVPPFPLND